MLENLELYIQGNSENYSTYYTRCDVEISREISSKPWETLARSLYSRKATAPGEKWEFTILGYHKDRTWKGDGGLSAWPFTLAFSGDKSWNSTETKQFKCPKNSFCKMSISMNTYSYWSDSRCHIKLKKDGKELQWLSRNWDGAAESYFIIPQGVIDVELYTWNVSGGSPTMHYTIYIQSDLSS